MPNNSVLRFLCAMLLITFMQMNTINAESETSGTISMVNKKLTENKIIIAADIWPPYNCDPKTNMEGYMVDITREVFKEKGYDIEYQIMSWRRALAECEKGIIDAVIGASKTDGKGLIFPEIEIARTHMSFYIRNNDPWVWNGLDSLIDKRIGVIKGYDYRDWLNNYIKENESNPDRVQILSGDEALKQNLLKLVAGRIDIVIDNENSIKYYVKQLGIDSKVRAGGYDYEIAKLYIAFSPVKKESKKYADILSDGILKLRKNGRLKEILDKYNLSDWIDIPKGKQDTVQK